MRRQIAALSLGIIGLIALAGCGTLGPRSIVQDRFNYNNALGESFKKQLLQNVVKIRYADMPVFLEVSSMVSQYEFKGSAAVKHRHDSLLSPWEYDAGVSYVEKPTISYTPLMGKEFIKSLMTPLPPEVIFKMIERGWPADFLFNISVQAINGMHNQTGFQKNSYPADSKFKTFLALLASIQQSGVLALGVEKYKDHEEFVLLCREPATPEIKSELESVLQLLGLDPGTRRFRITAGIIPKENKELTIQTRSIMMILEGLATAVEVPNAHIEEISLSTGPVRWNAGAKPLVRIFSGTTPPGDAYAAIEYRNHWFWINNNDFLSKRTFSFIQLLLNFSQAGREGIAPVLTLPAG